MKHAKRLLSMLLLASMLLSMLPAVALTASAADETWELTDISNITSDDVVVIAYKLSSGEYYAMANSNGTSKAPTATAITVTNNQISSAVTGDLRWNISKNVTENDTEYIIYPEGSTSTWLYCESNKNNGVRVGSNENKIFIIEGGYLKNVSTKRFVGVYNSADFRCYTGTTGNIAEQEVCFFKLNAGTPHSITCLPCENGSIQADKATARKGQTVKLTATAEEGYTLSVWTVLDANAETVEVSENTFVMPDSDVRVSATFAPKQKVTVSFNAGAVAVTDYVGESIVLPAFAGAEPEGYKFVGWAEQTVDETTDKPVFFAAGANYTMPETDKTLYALFTHTEGDGNGDYTLVTSAKELKIGATVVIAAKDSDVAMSSTQNGNNRPQVAITKNTENSTISFEADAGVAEFTLGKGKIDGTFSFYDANGYLYAASSNKNYMKSEKTLSNNSSWLIQIANGAAAVTAQGMNTHNVMCYNLSNKIFSCYAEQNRQKDICLYQKAGTTYYTTSPDTTTYTLTGIEITAMPTKRTFAVNEAFSSEGLVVTATYTAEKDPTKTKTADVTSKVSITGGDTSMAGTKTVNVSYTEGETTKTATYEITVKAAYTLTYDKNTTDDVTGLPEKVTGLAENEKYTLSTAAPVRANYTFAGWATSSDSAARVTAVTMDADKTVYAIWQEKTKFTVSFYTKEGATPIEKVYYEGDTVAAADVPTIDPIEGYAFKGWYGATYNNAAAPAYVTPAETKVTAELSFYAVYAELDDAASSETFTIARTYDGTTYYAAARVSNKNYLGATTSAKDAAEFRLESAGETDKYYIYDVTDSLYIGLSSGTALYFTATLTSNTAKLVWTYDAEKGTFKNNSDTTRYFTLNKDTKDRFATYADNANQTIAGGATIINYTTNPVSTKITVTWMNGTTVHEKMRVMYGVTIAAPKTKPEKAATEEKYYEFVGWAAEADGAVLSNFGTASATDGNKTFYAVFAEKAKLVATWNNYDGATLATKHYMPGETPVYPGSTEPTREADAEHYYTFAGWEPDLLPIAKDTTYVAKYEAHARFEASLTLNRNTVKIDRNAQATGKLTDAGKATTQYTPVYSSLNETVATIDAATGRITTLAVGTATIQVTYTVEGKEYTATQELNVVEGQTVAGYRLVTENLDDWSGDYVIMGKKNGAFDQAAVNNFFVLVPLYKAGEAPTFATNFTNAAPVGLDENGTGTFTLRSGSGFAASAIADHSISMASDDFYYTGKEKGTTLPGYNVITAISDEVVFTIECIDDVKGIYTIRVKGSNLYLAAPAEGADGTDKNRLYFSLESSELAQWHIRMETIQTNYTYDNPIVRISSAVKDNTYSLFFNGNNKGQFRDYMATSTDANIGYKDNTQTENGFGNYSLYLFGNPNPYKAQIYYLGNQVTIASPATVPSGAASAKLMSAIVPEIEDNSGWVQDGAPVWSIVEQSSGAAMSIDAATGVLSTNGAAADSYALVQVTYVLRDTASNAEHTVTTQAKAVIGETASYTHVIYENKSGMGTEVQYNVYKNANQTAGCTLPLGVYVVNNLTGASSKDGAVTVGGTAAWSVTNTTDATQTATISADGKLDYSGITKNSILLVTVNGLTGAAGEGAATAAKAGTFKVYVRVVSYAAEITHDNGTTGDFTAPFGATDIALGKVVRNADGNTAGEGTFTLTETSAYQWEASHGAKITANANGTATLDVSGLEPGTVITVRVSGLEAKVGDAVTEVPHATVRVTVGDRPQNVTAENITVVIDYDRKVTIDLSGRFTVANTELDTITVSDGAATDGFALAQIDGTWTVTFTPQGILREAKSCTYTVTAKDGSQAAGTITVQPASAVYYEDDNSAFTFTDGKHGKWATDKDGTTIDAQTSSLLSTDIIGYDENYDVKTYAKYSAGSVHYVNVTEAVQDENLTPKNPTVEFDFAGTGFDVISVTSNNTGAFLIEVTNAAGESVFTKLLSTYRGYEYVPDGYVRTDYIPVIRCDENGTVSDTGDYSKTVTGTGENDFTVRLEPDGFYAKQADGTFARSDAPGADGKWYVKREMTTQWRPVDDGENPDYYQIPVIRKLGLPYGVYHVKITAAYSRVFDVRQDGEYNFYFDAVRIYDPIEAEKGEYHYVSLRDAIIAAGTFGVTKIEPCEHDNDEDNAQWDVLQPATYSDNPTLNGRGMMVKLCGKCGNAIDYAYFYVTATAAETALHTDKDPKSTALSYTVSVDSSASEEAKKIIESLKPSEDNGNMTDAPIWKSADESVLVCFDTTAYARGAGETYATLTLKMNEMLFAEGVRTPIITVDGPAAYLITFTVHVEDTPAHLDGTPAENLEMAIAKDTVAVGQRYTIPTVENSAALYSADSVIASFVAEDFHKPELIGWTTTKTSAMNLTQTAPAYYEPGASFTPTEDTVLYPLFRIDYTCNSYVRTATVPTDSSTKVILSVKTMDEHATHFNYLPKMMCKTMTLYLPTDHRAQFEHAFPLMEEDTCWSIVDASTGGYTGKALRSADGTHYLRVDDTELSLGTDLTNATLEFYPDGNGAFYIYSNQNQKWLACNATANGTPYQTYAPFRPVASQSEATPIVLFAKGAQTPETITTYATTVHNLTYSGQSENNEGKNCVKLHKEVTICWCGEAVTTVVPPDSIIPTVATIALNATQHALVCVYCCEISANSIENHNFVDGVCQSCQYRQAGAGTAAAEVTPYAVSGGNVTGGAGAADTGASGGDANPGNPGDTGGTDTGGTDTGSTGNALNTIIGSGIIDGKGWLFDMEDFKKHGPKTEVYLAPQQAVVFYLEKGMEGTGVQLGAKAVNGAAAGLTVITLTGGTGGAVKTIADRPLVSATEMYYEIGGDLVWSNGTSCVVIVMNTGEGVLALTNIRSTASLNVVMNRDATESGQAVLQRIAAGTMVYGPDDFITIVDSSKLPASPDPVKPDPADPKPEPVKPDPVDPKPGDPSESKPSDPKPSDPKPSDPKPETPSVTDFTDLDKDAWYYDGVRYAVEAGLMNGTGAKTFEPDGKLTRAMLVTILYRLAGAPEVKTTVKFTDVPADAWYAKAVAWAAGQKITNGTTATTFDPNGNVTREQLVTLLWRYAGEPKTEGKLDAFPDAAKVAPYAQTAFAWAVENGVIKGDLVGKTGYLAPQGEATRAQIAAIFMRSEKLLAND